MSAIPLILRLLAYYIGVAALLLVVLWLYPDLQGSLPIGRTQALLAQVGPAIPPEGGIPTLAPTPVPVDGALKALPGFAGSLVWLATAILGALLASLPVSWVYMTIRNPKDYDQSLVDTIIMLPMVVTSVVVIVQHSLALAFALAGIAGAARYRNTLKSSGDLLFILLAISIGLAAGIGAVELAMLISAAFNAGFLFLWLTNYGERQDMKRFLAEFDHPNHVHVEEKHKKKKPKQASLPLEQPAAPPPEPDLRANPPG